MREFCLPPGSEVGRYLDEAYRIFEKNKKMEGKELLDELKLKLAY